MNAEELIEQMKRLTKIERRILHEQTCLRNVADDIWKKLGHVDSNCNPDLVKGHLQERLWEELKTSPREGTSNER